MKGLVLAVGLVLVVAGVVVVSPAVVAVLSTAAFSALWHWSVLAGFVSVVVGANLVQL